MRGAAVLRRMWTTFCNFYSRASCEARHSKRGETPFTLMISTHAPHARRGEMLRGQKAICFNFYSRASCEARLSPAKTAAAAVGFLLTRLMRGAAPPDMTTTQCRPISTHAPHARRGYNGVTVARFTNDFYSRASCEARQSRQELARRMGIFLLTRLMRGAANAQGPKSHMLQFLLTRLMRGAADDNMSFANLDRFLLTRPMRGAANWTTGDGHHHKYFYSRAPCEARQGRDQPRQTPSDFYSRAPCEARPDFRSTCAQTVTISTHAPHARRGANRVTDVSYYAFLLTRPMRGAALSMWPAAKQKPFLLTRPMRGAAIIIK